MISRRTLSVLFIASLAAGCGSETSTIQKAISEGKPLVRVGDEKINEGYLTLLERINPSIKGQLDMPMGKKRLVDNLIEQELLYQESLKRGLEKDPLVKEKAELYKRVIVAQSLLDNEVDKKAADYYKEKKDQEFERVKVSQIFFSNSPKLPPPQPGKTPPAITDEDRKKADADSESRAKAVYDRLKKGESWDELVKESDDKTSATRGGDFGFITRADRRIERMEYQKLVEQAFTLAKGSYSEPIKAKDGWHIIQVTEEKKSQSYDEVSMAIKSKIRGEVKNTLLAELKKKGKIQYLDTSLAESMPAAPSAPSAPANLEMPAGGESKPAGFVHPVPMQAPKDKK